jgi:hypothetical protein
LLAWRHIKKTFFSSLLALEKKQPMTSTATSTNHDNIGQHYDVAGLIMSQLLYRNSMTLHKQYMQMLSKHGTGFLMTTLCSPINAVSEEDI